MSSVLPVSRAERRRVVAPLFVALFLTYGYGIQNPFNVNVVSRMALAVCAALEGRLSIEPFHEATVDKAFRAGHFYSDKAPGLSLAAVPIVAGVIAATGGGAPADLAVSEPVPGGPLLTLRFAILVLVATPLLNGLATALAACALYLAARRLGRGPRPALVAALAFALGTPAWGWATAFFGHALAGALAFVAFVVTMARLESGRGGLPGWIGVGLLLGYSVLTEYPLVAPAAIIMAVAALGARRFGASANAALGIALGAAGPAVVLLAYNHAVSGSMLSLAYEHVVGFDGMKQGLMGVTYPRADALWGILFSERKGLLWVAPLAALVPFAFWRARRSMPLLYWGAALAIVLYFVLFNASYAYWDGGGSTGPRHLTPALGFACLPLAWAWGGDLRARAIMGVVLGASVAVSLVSASTTMMPSWLAERPLHDVVFPAFAAGEISNLSSVLAEIHPGSAFVSGFASLVPLAVLWVVAGSMLGRATRQPPESARPGASAQPIS